LLQKYLLVLISDIGCVHLRAMVWLEVLVNLNKLIGLCGTRTEDTLAFSVVPELSTLKRELIFKRSPDNVGDI
jgi:hypothetical protein